MITIPTALRDIIRGNPLLAFGFQHRLFNLTRLAEYLRPIAAARTKKDVQASAVTMALSRLLRELSDDVPRLDRFTVESVSIHSGLSALTYARGGILQRRLNEFYRRVLDKGGFCSLTQGMHEQTIIFDSRYREGLEASVTTTPLRTDDGIAAVGVQFDPRYVEVPGLLYLLLQRVALQNINLVEISSTYTEAMLFVAERDARLVFDTLFESFLIRSSG